MSTLDQHCGYVTYSDRYSESLNALPIRISQGTTAITQFLNVELDDRFVVIQDGDVQVDFAPFVPTHREGSSPDTLVPAMEQVGFDFSTEELDPDDPDYKDSYPTEAAFALTEYLTGIRLTPQILASPDYVYARVPKP